MIEFTRTVDWLLAQPEPWVIFNTHTDLLEQPGSNVEVRTAYTALKKHPLINKLIEETKIWPAPLPLGRAYDPKDSIWKISVLADFGLRRDDERIEELSKSIMANQAEAPAPPGFLHGGFDHTRSWDKKPYICISHVLTYSLSRFGCTSEPEVIKAYKYIQDWQRVDGGWHPNKACLPDGERADDPSCPFGTVNVLRAISANPEMLESEYASKGVSHVLNLWERRTEPYRPVGFGMGTTFNKLQYPFVQHQLLKTVDTLSNFTFALTDSRFENMLDTLLLKATPEGYFKADGANKPFAEFDFGQKKQPSPWATFLCIRAWYRFQKRSQGEH